MPIDSRKQRSPSQPVAGSPRQPRLLWHRKLIFGIVAALALLLLAEGFLAALFLFVDLRSMLGADRIEQRPVDRLDPGENLESFHSQYDDELGWVHIPGRVIEDFYGPGLDMTINASGLRGKVDHAGDKPEETYRVVCLGDSMTMGYGVDDSETYPARLERADPDLQVLNMGMGGYSACQCGLWYRRMHEQLQADLLVFSIIADDVARIGGQAIEYRVVDRRVEVINRPVPHYFRPTELEAEAFRFSRFLVEHSSIAKAIDRIIPTRAPRTGARSADPMELTAATITELALLTRQSGQDFAVVLLPNSSEIPGHKYFNLENQRTFWLVSQMLEQTTRELDVPYLNLLPTFASRASDDLEELFLTEVYAHYSPAGNNLIALTLDEWLARSFPRYPRPSDRDGGEGSGLQ